VTTLQLSREHSAAVFSGRPTYIASCQQTLFSTIFLRIAIFLSLVLYCTKISLICLLQCCHSWKLKK
jgi:hypothetical protein